MRLKQEILFSITAIAVVVVDQVTKYFAYAGKLSGFLNMFKPVFGADLLPNYNFAFSIRIPHVVAYLAYALLIVLFITWYSSSAKKKKERVGFYLIVGGAISNLADRAFLGYVRDFIGAFWGNIFNIADIAIVAGIILILLASI